MSENAASAVLVIGESIVDVLRTGDRETRSPGGSPLNVAYGLGRLGVRTNFVTRIGPDPDGDLLRAHLADANVEVLAASLGSGPTSTAIATIQRDGSAEYVFNISWSLPTLEGIPIPRWVHVGSIATFLNPGADSLERLLFALSRRIPISYDPNIRPRLITNRSEALARFERIASIARVIKMSSEDRAWLYPQFSDVEALKHVLALGPSLVGITLGQAGAILATQEVCVEIAARPCELVDTVGAGDSFMAALILGVLTKPVLSRETLQGIGAVAAMAAGITCSRAGAAPPTMTDLLARVPLVDPVIGAHKLDSSHTLTHVD